MQSEGRRVLPTHCSLLHSVDSLIGRKTLEMEHFQRVKWGFGVSGRLTGEGKASLRPEAREGSGLELTCLTHQREEEPLLPQRQKHSNILHTLLLTREIRSLHLNKEADDVYFLRQFFP